ncbi:YybH family protein [Brevibacterium casei]|uniref:YybH family protein n=1 Tax=Brevibacterium casei TaxID=33889 RepID=UPI00241F2561|nr:nuclear transport factor 2 family protein [Brevibacterium casei]
MTEKSNQPDSASRGAASDPATPASTTPSVSATISAGTTADLTDEALTPTVDAVTQAAATIVEAFAATDTKAYFAGFAEDASFIFHPEDLRLNSRAEYEETWRGWHADGWSVVWCVSSDPLVQTFPGGAVFSHTVDTTVETGSGRESYRERESIVFRHLGEGHLIAIHEHLSTVPGDDGSASADSVTSDGQGRAALARSGDAPGTEAVGR